MLACYTVIAGGCGDRAQRPEKRRASLHGLYQSHFDRYPRQRSNVFAHCTARVSSPPLDNAIRTL